MAQAGGSGPFGADSIAPAIAHLETGEKLLEAIESKYVSITKQLDDLNPTLDKFEKLSTGDNIQHLRNSIIKLSENQIYDLSFLLRFYAQRQSWIDPKDIADAGNRHDYRVVKKNLIGQDRKFRWARGQPAIRELVESSTIGGKVMFRPKGLISEFAISFFYLRRSLNVLSDTMEIMEEFVKFIESLTPIASEFLESADKSDEKLNQYPEIPKSVLKVITKFASVRKNHLNTLLESKSNLDSAFFHQTNEGIKKTLEDIRNSSNMDMILILKTQTEQIAKGLFDCHRQNLLQCARFLQFCKSFIEYEVKNRDLRRIRNELVTLMSKFSDVDKMIKELISDYAKDKISKEYYEKQLVQLDKVLAEIVKKMIFTSKQFELRKSTTTQQSSNSLSHTETSS